MEVRKLIVSRHPAAVEFVHSLPEWADAEVSTGNVDTVTVQDREVCGPLPLALIAQCARYWAIEFTGTPPRGQEYDLAIMLEAGAGLVEYRVSSVPIVKDEISWSNRQANRDREAFCLLIRGGDLYEFVGKAIPGVCQARVTENHRQGKWSFTTYAIRLAPGVRMVAGHTGWQTGSFAEGLAAAIGTSEWTLQALAAALHVSPAALCALAEHNGSTKTVQAWLAELDDVTSRPAAPPPGLQADGSMAAALRQAGLD